MKKKMSNQILIQECVYTTSKILFKKAKEIEILLENPSFVLGRVVKELLTLLCSSPFFKIF